MAIVAGRGLQGSEGTAGKGRGCGRHSRQESPKYRSSFYLKADTGVERRGGLSH
jgi:hypothetical protein